MKNLLKNLYLNLSGETNKLLTQEELGIADNAIHLFQSEIYEMDIIINQEKEKVKTDVSNSIYNIDNMVKIRQIVHGVMVGMNFLSANTYNRLKERSNSLLANLMLSPDNACEVKGNRKFDISSIPIVLPHTLSEYKNNFPDSFLQCLRRIKHTIENEKLFSTFAPIDPLLGRNFSLLFSITSKIIK